MLHDISSERVIKCCIVQVQKEVYVELCMTQVDKLYFGTAYQ